MKIDKQFMHDFCAVSAPHMVPRVDDWAAGADDAFMHDLASHMDAKAQKALLQITLWQAIANMTNDTFATA